MLTWLWAMGQEVVAFIDAVRSRLQRLAHLGLPRLRGYLLGAYTTTLDVQACTPEEA